ncbi:MAG: hypothetical protein M3Y59_18605 [Myxococcota bacterium]|nr:hypothetical protein [Myxococcota bacterium]
MFEERPRPRRKLPSRTLILMIVALVAFARMWWVLVETPARQERQAEEQKGPTVIDVVPLAPDAG